MLETADQAVALMQEGYSCSQAVFASFAPRFGFHEDLALKMTAPFGGGIARHGYICGGGAHNLYLLERLQLALPECGLATTAALGLDPDFVEASAFAWLARERMQMRPGNIPEVTKARREAILGGVYAGDESASARESNEN